MISQAQDNLERAVDCLLSVCDGASTQDGSGFNGWDAPFARDLAEKKPWTPGQRRAVWRMLRKYSRQLDGFGISYAEIPEPPDPKAMPAQAPLAGMPTPQPRGVTIEHVEGAAQIKFPYNPATVELMRQVPGRSWDGLNKQWLVDLGRPGALAGLQRFAKDTGASIPVSMAQQVERAAEAKALEDAAMTDRVKGSMATDADFVVEGLGGELMPFQRAGVKYATEAKRCLIADEMGLGKTVQALASLRHLAAFPALVVCPASVKLNWAREARKWLPGVDVGLLGTDGAGLFGSQQQGAECIRIVNYDILHKVQDQVKALAPKAVVFDECHYLKSHKSLRGKAAKEMVQGIEVRLCMTGTPILNRPGELFHQLGLLGRVEDVGGFQHFRKRYLGYDWKGDGKNLEELQRVVRSKFLIRREKADVLRDLPAKRRTVVDMELADPKAYRDLEDAELEDSPAAAIVRLGELRREAARQKLVGIREWVGEFLETGKKLVLFATHREVQHALIEAFPNCLRILGDMDIKDRQEAVDRFQEDPEQRLIVCSLKAAGVGLTLTAASDVAFCEMGWTPADMDQAEDRCHRIGQEDSVTAWYLMAPGTVDQSMMAMVDRKRLIADKMLKAGQMLGATKDEGKMELAKGLLDKARAAGRLVPAKEAQ